MMRLLFIISIALSLSLSPSTRAQNLSEAQIDTVRFRLADAAQQSWELGTRAEALLELDASAFSVFAPTLLPFSPSLSSTNSTALAPVLSIARNTVAQRPASNANASGPQPLVNDGAAGDPASLGVAILLANWTGQGAGDGEDYAGAARDQLEYLYWNVPRTSDGAISHRVAEVQLWSDFVYMVPPFLAYYAVTTANRTLLADAYTQIRLYRSYLRDASAGGLWRHIDLGSAIPLDAGHWSTGNGWAAAGILRVLATMQHSQFAGSFKHEQADLANWVTEIHNGMFPHLDLTGVFRNYADNTSTFYDAASSALLASTVYQLALLRGTHTHLPAAERVRRVLSNGTAHVSAEGWLAPVVDPQAFGVQGNVSAEGEAFVLQMQAAWRAWVADGAKGANGGVLLRVGGRWVVWVGVGVVWGVLGF